MLLTHFYNEYIQKDNSNKVKIANKWANQNKEEFSQRLLKNETMDIGTIIQDETYTLTEIDIFLIAYKTKTPIVVYKQSKKSIKTLRLITKENEKYYFDKNLHITADFELILRLSSKYKFCFDKISSSLLSIEFDKYNL